MFCIVTVLFSFSLNGSSKSSLVKTDLLPAKTLQNFVCFIRRVIHAETLSQTGILEIQSWRAAEEERTSYLLANAQLLLLYLNRGRRSSLFPPVMMIPPAYSRMWITLTIIDYNQAIIYITLP